MTLDIPDSRVFDWLGVSSNGVGYYLHALNLMWSDEGPEHDLARFRAVARRLRQDSEYWSEILRTPAWRHALVGCVCVMLARPNGRFDDLLYRFRQGSFVSPQICMTMGIVYPDAAVDGLDSFLDDRIGGKCDSKQTMSAHCVLTKLGVTRPDSVHARRLGSVAHDEAMIAKKVIEKQWDFWADASRVDASSPRH